MEKIGSHLPLMQNGKYRQCDYYFYVNMRATDGREGKKY